jgi:hypothetical protein
MDQSGTYKYEPLLEASGIRILLLKPSKDLGAKVECSLVNTTLRKYENQMIDYYTALSYVWGDPKATKTISVDEVNFEVTANLESALRHIRDPSVTRSIWADAVCINQSDCEEKGQQVNQMGDVYKLARQTIIYLGEATKESNLFLSYVQSSNSMYMNALETASADGSNALSHWPSILDCDWFTRIWTFQELILSTDPWVQRGSICVRWKELYPTITAIKGLDESDERLKVFTSMHERWKTYQSRSTPEVWTSPDSLLSILEERRGLGASDPRDILFGHLGVVRLDYERLVESNYTKTTNQVYGDLAEYLLTEHRYDILSHRDFVAEAGPQTKNLATWAPDWTAKKPSPPYRSIHEALHMPKPTKYERFTSSGYTRFKEPCHRIAPSVLGCAGFRIGTIFKVSPVITALQASFTIDKNSTIVGELPKPYHNTLTYFLHGYLKAWPLVYEHWKEIIDPLLVDSNSARSGMPKMDIRWNSKYTPFPKNLFHGEYTDIEFGKKYDDATALVHNITHHPIRRLATHLLLHATPCTRDMDHFIDGRKFAALDDGTLCLVPASAEAGDSACFFYGNINIPFVLRPIKREHEQAGLLSDSSILEKFLNYGRAQVGHYELIGQCWVDKWMGQEQFESRRLFHCGPNEQASSKWIEVQKEREKKKVEKEMRENKKKSGWKKWFKGGRKQDDDEAEADGDVNEELWLDTEIFALH